MLTLLAPGGYPLFRSLPDCLACSHEVLTTPDSAQVCCKSTPKAEIFDSQALRLPVVALWSPTPRGRLPPAASQPVSVIGRLALDIPLALAIGLSGHNSGTAGQREPLSLLHWPVAYSASTSELPQIVCSRPIFLPRDLAQSSACLQQNDWTCLFLVRSSAPYSHRLECYVVPGPYKMHAHPPLSDPTSHLFLFLKSCSV